MDDQDKRQIIHILPIDDLDTHEEEGTECRCNPRVEKEPGQLIIIHNAFDQREFFEKNPMLWVRVAQS
jgi:hypothetical protein